MKEQDIIDRITALARSRGWTLYRLSKQSGITYSTLCTMLHKATAPSMSTLIKLCQGFGISLSEFFDTEGGWAVLTDSQKSHLDRWNALSSDSQQAADKYIDFLIQEQTGRGH